MRTDADKLVFLGRLTGGVAVIVAGAWIVGLVRLLASHEYGGEALDVDFSAYWAAAKLTIAEGPLVPFDMERLNAARGLPPDIETAPMLWLYPPGWLVVILPFGYLPFFWGWLIFSLISLLIFAAVLNMPCRDLPGSRLLILASPVALLVLALGQNSLLFLSLLIAAIEAMRREKWVLAGLVIAVMTLKPQLGLAIPVALAFGGYWRVIFWATLGTVVIVALSLLWPGLEYWPAFFEGVSKGSDVMRDSYLPSIMASAYGTAVVLGVGQDLALLLQVGFSLVVAAALGWIWYARVSFDLKAAGLAFSVLLITPYAIYYELIFVLVGFLYLARAGGMAQRGTAFLGVIVWALPVLALVLLKDGPGFALAAPLVLVAFGTVLWQAKRAEAFA